MSSAPALVSQGLLDKITHASSRPGEQFPHLLDGRPRHAVRATRVVIKDAAFTLLQDMVAVLDRHPRQHRDITGLDAMLAVLMDSHLAQLRARMAVTVDEVTPVLSTEDAALLAGEYLRWTANSSWELINAADPCGT